MNESVFIFKIFVWAGLCLLLGVVLNLIPDIKWWQTLPAFVLCAIFTFGGIWLLKNSKKDDAQ